MGVIQPRTGKGTFYPDWSTIVYAFDPASAGSPEASRCVRDLLEGVSKEANLCLSYTHVLELLRAGDLRSMRERAAWIDTLDVVWLMGLDSAQRDELTQVLLRAAEVPGSELRLPAATSFMTQFKEMRWDHTPEFLRNPGVRGFVDNLARQPALVERLDEFAALGYRTSQKFFADRQEAVAAGLDAAHLESFLAAKQDAGTLKDALALSPLLAAECRDYRVKAASGLFVAPDDAFVRSAVSTAYEMRSQLPAHYILGVVYRRAGDAAQRKPSLSGKYFSPTKRRGDPFDWQHLVGAAYCDAFSCDEVTAEHIDDSRSHIGKPPPIVWNGNAQAFADQVWRDLDV